MLILTFAFTASATQSWTADKDYVFVNAYIPDTSFAAVISNNPSLTATNLTAPSSAGMIPDVLWVAGANAKTYPLNLKIPVSAGTTLFVNKAGVGSVLLYLDDVSAEI